MGALLVTGIIAGVTAIAGALEKLIASGVKSDSRNNTDNQIDLTYVDPYTHETKTATIGGSGYKHNELFRTSTSTDVAYAIEYILKNGYDFENPSMSNDQFATYLTSVSGNPVAANEVPEILSDARHFITQNIGNYEDVNKVIVQAKEQGILQEEIENQKQIQSLYQEQAFNDYYNDLYSLKPGTLGRTMLDNFTLAEQNAAISNMELAEAQYQSSAMQQAETVKAITDSVKAERMARLRAGMNESQIANQDMQTMLNNMNTLNQNMDVLNQNRYAAQQQYNLAQDTAYQQYIQAVTGLGSTSAAMAGSDAADAYMQAKKLQQKIGGSFATSHRKVLNTNSNSN